MLTKPGERAVNGDDREVNEGRSGPTPGEEGRRGQRGRSPGGLRTG